MFLGFWECLRNNAINEAMKEREKLVKKALADCRWIL